MMEQTKIVKAFKGIRGRAPIDEAALEQLLVRFSQLVVEQRWIKEVDINPLLASPERLIALDARVVLQDPDVTLEQLPRLAIRAYPRRYATEFTARDGSKLTLRPIRPEDEPLVVKFHASLSAETVYQRYFKRLGLDERVAHDRLIRICFTDYDRELPLVAEHETADGHKEIVGISRLSKERGGTTGEVAGLVTDAWQGKGIGRELMRRIVEIAKAEKLEAVTAHLREENWGMRGNLEALGFTVTKVSDDGFLRADLELA